MSKAFLSALAICSTLCASTTLWVYDPTTWRHTPDAMLNTGSVSTIDSQTLEQCKSECTRVGYTCLSFGWNGDIDSPTSTSSCKLFKSRFGFASGGLNPDDPETFGSGTVAMLEARDRSNYFEKPMDLADTIGDQLTANVLRLNGKDYDDYTSQSAGQYATGDRIDYQSFLLYYRAGVPGYVGINDTESESKYSVVMEYEEVEDAEECAMYCTRARGLMDPTVGTRCISFNYNTDGTCHLLSFALDGTSYNITDLPTSNAEKVNSGWFYYEALQGAGCWIVQGQCRKWDDETYVSQQEANDRYYTVGVHVGVIREYATDPVCSKCFTPDDFSTEFEYICLDKARTYHEDYCDNDADSATVAYWGQDGAGVAEIWNSWDLSQGCVIDLSTFECNPDPSKYEYPIQSPNPRFDGKKFRDSIGEEEYAAAIDKRRCFQRAKEWYDYCELGSQQSDDGGTAYLNVTFATDGSFYMEPAIPCSCDEYGVKIEKEFGLVRQYCTRDWSNRFCYREKQEDYWTKIDLLCDDTSEGYECDVTETDTDNDAGTGCYLYYPIPTNILRTAHNFRCAEGGRYNFNADEDFTVVNEVIYKEITCEEQNMKSDCEFDADTCYDLAKHIHNSCGNNFETEADQVVVWYRPTGEIMVFPDYEYPYETTLIRGMVPGTKYTESPGATLIDTMPIRNGRWQTFTPERTGNLRQLDLYYENTVDADLTCTVWYGRGITKSIFLNQVTISVPAQEVGWIRFPLQNVTVTAESAYTWQITATAAESTELGYLGYVRGNRYGRGVGDLAWDYLFVAWVEGDVTSNPDMKALIVGTSGERPWFEIWCVMIMVLFLIFMVFLCVLHWKRKHDEAEERKEDRKFQAELRQRAMLQAEAERNARTAHQRDLEEEEYEDADADSRTRTPSRSRSNSADRSSDTPERKEDYEEEFDETELDKKREQNTNLLTPGGGDEYNRVKSYSKNEMPGYDKGDSGYQDPERKKKKKKKKKKKHGDAEYDEY